MAELKMAGEVALQALLNLGGGIMETPIMNISTNVLILEGGDSMPAQGG